ncbi:MAG: 4-hydroxy-tetrahydrodipicolinate reductase [Bacteroidales bacterium]|nr:4-hydroxy-tetrahydrodipicolinate reductase [Bacteroidales bacterium]
MKIAIIGYGRMGREIESAALEKGHEIVAFIDDVSDWEKQAELLQTADVAIEFSIPSSAPDNILRCFEKKLPVVSGTTAWLDRIDEIKNICIQKNQAFFYAPNYSIGVNIFFELNHRLAQLMKDFPEYEISITEAHHAQKADAPSGTAIRLADDIIKEIEHKKGWTGQEPDKSEIPITSIREGNITGSHSVTYEFEFDKIEIHHDAKNRKGFAVGAVMAAEWIIGKKGCFGMSDLLNPDRKQ